MTKELVAMPKAVPDYRILIGTSVRKSADVVELYLKSLDRLILPPGVSVFYCFVDDNNDPASSALLADFVAAKNGVAMVPEDRGAANGYKDDGVAGTHEWSGQAMGRVAHFKNLIIKATLDGRFDAVFFCDADLLLEPTTLASLVHLDAPVGCAVYWTRWVNTPQIHAAPQVWLQHPYGLQGRGYRDEAEFRKKLLDKQPTQVWGQGACSLIKRFVLEKGVDFSILEDLPKEGMWQGEDRHFCVKCERLHIPMVADPWPDIFHVYHPQDRDKSSEWYELLGETQAGSPGSGDWVSVRVDAIESGPGASRFHRGRLGVTKFLPEITHALSQLTRGDSALVAAHIGSTYPFAGYRNTRRLFRVTLIDHKPFRFPPVVTDEIYQWKASGAVQDGTQLTMEQHEGLVAEASK